MLPNWPNPFIKFAGARAEFIFGYDKEIMGRNIEEAVFTELRILLETFVHYTWVRSDQTFIFADLQGAWSRDKQVFILADPQLHTSTNNGNNLAPIASWDSKMDGIASYFASHECDSFCDYLNLSEVRFKDKPAKQSAGLKNILNDVNRSPKARGT
ncbi:hypothetical protein M407DRAFT_240816 [Tulasnella calospora MUT 4182]|uniref:Alpha-type protein kinase domain-containing protein n=1 Tax=Tulasnella calospora MUT 4182 TaxID=1051891 RepID=A0A0C3LIU3_9AGAM|nr:hypothetical protein M407DRAFT_240816 [Tulasnella calospora MUT 4182]